MVEIPDNVTDVMPDERADMIDKVCEEIAAKLRDQRNRGCARLHTQVTTEHCATGGYPMYAILEAAKRFASKGWYCYLIRGGAYRNWTWLGVYDRERPEGYDEANIPSYFERVR